jgi:hypothetical protein
LHVLMSQAEMELWKSLADWRRLDVDDVVHAAALSGLTYHFKHAGDEIGPHVAAVCEGEPIARLGLEDIAPDVPSVWEPRAARPRYGPWPGVARTCLLCLLASAA